MTITALPTPPTRSDPANFAARGDALMTALPTFVTEANALQTDVNAKQALVAADYAAALAAGLENAEANAAAAVSNAATATTQNDQANTSAQAAAASAAAAATARDLALTAWNASTAPAEILAANSQSLHIGTIVKAVIDDTSKHSDGGASRKRCTDKSWYTEALGGDRWIYQQATIAAAWTAAGSTTGATFQASATAGPLTIGKFYAATSATTATEVFRGIQREYPARCGWMIETAREICYDLDTGAMWKVIIRTGKTLTSIAAINGKVIVGSATGVFVEDFLADRVGAIEKYTTATTPAIVNNTVNDVAITVLDSSPIDVSTGLPVPTIYAFTAGGVSRIADDGTVSSTATVNGNTAGWIKDDYVYGMGQNGVYPCVYPIKYSLPTGGASNLASYWTEYYGTTTVPAILSGNSRGARNAIGSALGLSQISRNPTTPTKGMVAYVTPVYNTGWMPGDIRLATLADTVAETVTASTPLDIAFSSYADFAAMTAAGWAKNSAATVSIVSGNVRIENIPGPWAQLSKSFPAVIGKTYTVSAARVSGTAGMTIGVGWTTFNSGYGASTVAEGSASVTFVAQVTTIYVTINPATSSGTIDVSSVSVKLVEPDRSVKNNGLIVNGTLTKAPVAAGSALVAYSGFSAANYLEQPYNSQLDFSTLESGRHVWIKFAATTAKEVIWCRDSASTGVLSRLQLDATTSCLSFTMFDGTTTRTATGATALDDGNWHLVETRYSLGTLTILVDGVSYSTATGAALLTMNNATAVLRVGVDCQGANPAASGNLCLKRISATVASNDQSSQFYRDELPLFQAGAQCTLAGTSAAVTALAYDDVTDLLQVGTATHRSAFKGLLRVESEATPAGAITSIAASGGTLITGGTSGYLYQPEIKLRDELRRKDEARRALGKAAVFFPFAAATSQVAFVLPAGYTAKAVYSAGLLKDVGTTLDYTTNTDGYKETVTFAVAPGNGVRVNVMATRNY